MNVTVVDIEGTPHRIHKEKQPNFTVFARHSGKRYLVLASSDGELFNKLDINDNTNKKDRERGGMFWQLRTCSQECYDQYTIFLRSKSRTPYLLAQRRFRNDFR